MFQKNNKMCLPGWSDIMLRKLCLNQTQPYRKREVLLMPLFLKYNMASINRKIPGNTKMKHAAKPPISEMTLPMSGMKRARISVRQNQMIVCSILLLRSFATSVSTSSPLKRSHRPSNTALNSDIYIPSFADTHWMLSWFTSLGFTDIHTWMTHNTSTV